MKILFFPQNETHLNNMLPIVEELEKKDVQCFFIDASSLYHQDIFKAYENLKLVKINLESAKPFYVSSSFEKFRLTKEFKKIIKELNLVYDCLVFGNDGSLQRVVLSVGDFRKSVYMLDAIINDNTFSIIDALANSPYKLGDVKDWFRRKFKLFLMRIIRHLPFNYYFPSEIGTVIVDKYFVMGDYVKDVLTQRGLPKEIIEVTGLPRFKGVYKYKHLGENLSPNGQFKILTLTQSAVWHNDVIKEDVQKKQLFKLINLVEKLRIETGVDVQLNIRLHPRDIVEDRSYFFEKDFVNPVSGSLYPQLLEHDIVVATTSTVLVENLAMNGRVAIMFLENQWWRYKRSFLKLDCFPKFYDEISLQDNLRNIINGESYKRVPIDNLISPKSKDCEIIIANEILNLIKYESSF